MMHPLVTGRSRSQEPGPSTRSTPRLRRSLRCEVLEQRLLLSVSAPLEPTEPSAIVSTLLGHGVRADDMWFIPDGEVGVPYGETLTPADFEAVVPWPDRDPSAPGIQLTYSYSNFLDGGLPGGLTPEQLMVATEEALQLWASAAPLHFREVEDSGAGLDDVDYPAASHPDVRIGHHFIDGGSGPNVIAHAYFPVLSDGLSGDVHFDNGNTWSVHPSNGIDVIEVMAHELGHSLVVCQR